MVINLKYHSFPMTQQTLIASIETLHYFINISGLKVNIDKTNIIRLGKDRNDHRKMCPKYN